MFLDEVKLPQIQVALDPPIALESLCEIAKQAYNGGARVIEAGTPALKLHGLRNILPALKKEVPNSVLVADMKTMDVGDLEAKIAFDHGADVVSVLAIGTDTKIKEAMQVAIDREKAVLIDLIDVQQPLQRIKQLKRMFSGNLGRIIFTLHRGISQQREKGAGIYSEKHLITKVSKILQKGYLAIAGGLQEGEIRALSSHADIFIVGGTITGAKNAEKTTKNLLREARRGREEP